MRYLQNVPQEVRVKMVWSLTFIAGSDSDEHVINESMENTIPVVGLLVQGTPCNMDHVLYYLTNKMPVLVLKGSGGLADMIAYAYEEIQEKWVVNSVDPVFQT